MLNSQLTSTRQQLLQFTAAISLLLFVAITATQAQTNTTTFGQFFQRDTSAQNFVFTNNGNNGTFNTVANGNPVYFNYGGITGLPVELQGIQNATITMVSSTTLPAIINGSDLTQPINQSFIIAIIRDTPASTGAGTRRNLLTATVTQGATTAEITGSGNAASYSASTPSSTNQMVIYSSDFLDFTQTNARNFSISFSSVTPTIAMGPGGFTSSFTASGSGTFASNPPPPYNPPTAAIVSIGGRVLTADGRGVSRALVNLTDSTGMTRTAVTNSFGYYRFGEVQAGQAVVMAVTAKRYTFATQVVSVTDELTALNFTALE